MKENEYKVVVKGSSPHDERLVVDRRGRVVSVIQAHLLGEGDESVILFGREEVENLIAALQLTLANMEEWM